MKGVLFLDNKILSSFKKKLKNLWKDKRPYGKRLLCAGAVMLAACFTFLFFGPLEMVAFASSSLDYGYTDVLPLLAITAFCVCIVGSLLISLIRGKIFNYIVTFIFGTTVCGYLQAALMNGNLGLLNGEPIDWPLYKKTMIINLLIWVAVFVVILFVMYINKKFWRKAVTLLAVILVVMQLAPTIGILLGQYQDDGEVTVNECFISQEGINEYSKNDNIFVFVLDYMDYTYIKSILKTQPQFLDKLDGFTGYTDAVPNFSRTKPALNVILTGSDDLPYRVHRNDFLSDAWTHENKNILKTLTDKNYSVDIYATFSYLFSDVNDAYDYVSNLETDKSELNKATLLRKLINLSAYRYTPIALKPYFWADTNYYNADVFKSTNNAAYTNYQSTYTERFINATAERNQPSFKFYHFYGSHPPYYMDENGAMLDVSTSVEQATMGGFNNLYKTFDRMKELGIYDDATIIITADHGDAATLVGNELTPMQIGLFYKPSGSANKPLVWSDAQVSTANIPATIVKAAGGDYSAYGIPLDEVPIDQNVKRVFNRCIVDPSTWNDDKIQVYEVFGKGNESKNYTMIESFEIDDKNKLYG